MSIRAFLATFAGLVLVCSHVAGEIEPETAIQISILGVLVKEGENMDAIYPVSGDGTINMPFIGRFKAERLEAEAFEVAVENVHKEVELSQSSIIQVIGNAADKNTKSGLVFVGGHECETGSVAWQQCPTIYQAFQIVGGADELGAMDRVRLHRAGVTLVLDLRDPGAMGALVQPKERSGDPHKLLLGC